MKTRAAPTQQAQWCRAALRRLRGVEFAEELASQVKANEPLWREMMAACRPDEAPRADESAPNGGAPGAKKARRERLAKTG